MVEKVITRTPNIVDFARYQANRGATAPLARTCRHCGAALSEGESEDECSSAFNVEVPRLREAPRKFYAE
jgi:hypothetical protein